MRRPLLLVVATGQELAIVAGLPVELIPANPPRKLRISAGGETFLLTRVVAAGGARSWTFAGYPSSGTGGAWSVFLVEAEGRVTARVRALWEDLATWVASAANDAGGGQQHVLGAFTPAVFQARAPAAVWTAALASWSRIWGPGTAAAQQALGDSDLEE
jgi:hypothetical protein